jgi:hypothetical protein
VGAGGGSLQVSSTAISAMAATAVFTTEAGFIFP